MKFKWYVNIHRFGIIKNAILSTVKE